MRSSTMSAGGHRTTTRGHRARQYAVASLSAATLALLTACGTDEAPDASAPPAATEEPTSDTGAPTTEAPTTDEPTTEAPTTEQPSEEPTTDPTTGPTEEPTSEAPTNGEPPEEGTGEAMPFARQYVELVTSGDVEGAFGMLSPESMAYFPDVPTFERNGIADLAADLSGSSGEPQWAIRSAYEETHDSAQVVSIWGEGSDGEPFAHSFAIRQLDGVSWVVDQDITPSTGANRLNWLNPGIQEGVDPWVVNPDAPITFALLKEAGPNVAVTASIDDGSEVSQQLTERPTGGAVMYDLSDSALSDGLHVVTASWVAEDQPFVHTSSTPAMNP